MDLLTLLKRLAYSTQASSTQLPKAACWMPAFMDRAKPKQVVESSAHTKQPYQTDWKSESQVDFPDNPWQPEQYAKGQVHES